MEEQHTCQLPRFPRSLQVFHQISRETPTAAFCQNCFIHFVIFEMSKRKITQEVDFVLLLELFSIGKCKTERSNCKKLTRFSYTVYVSLAKMAVWHIRKPCGWLSESIQTLLKMASVPCKIINKSLDVSRFLYSGSWQEWTEMLKIIFVCFG